MIEVKFDGKKILINKNINSITREKIETRLRIALNYKLYSVVSSTQDENNQNYEYRCYVCGTQLKHANLYKNKKNGKEITVGNNCHKTILQYQFQIEKIKGEK